MEKIYRSKRAINFFCAIIKQKNKGVSNERSIYFKNSKYVRNLVRIRKYLAKFVDLGLLEAQGANKNRIYKIKKEV